MPLLACLIDVFLTPCVVFCAVNIMLDATCVQIVPAETKRPLAVLYV